MFTPATAPRTSTYRSTSQTRKPPSRPSTPLRPSSRTSLRESQTFTPGASGTSSFPLEALEPAFAELSDSMADLEANFMHLQLMHESLSRFNESFAAFLYGLNMNAFCVDFPEQPLPQSFARVKNAATTAGGGRVGGAGVGGEESTTFQTSVTSPDRRYPSTSNDHSSTDETFMTNETSFMTNNPPSTRIPMKYAHPAGSQQQQQRRQRPLSGAGRGTRGGDIARAGSAGGPGTAGRAGRGTAGRGRPGSGVSRGIARGGVGGFGGRGVR